MRIVVSQSIRRAFVPLLLVLWVIAGCVQPQPGATTPEAAAPEAAAETTTPAPQPEVDLSGIKSYLLEQATALAASTAALKEDANAYYALAEANGFDYAALWDAQSTEITPTLEAARAEWMNASPLYEQMEGIVAGTPSLAEFDVILDAGAGGDEDPENAVPFDLTLPDGRVLPKPGNLFGVTESTLWGTYPEFVAGDVEADWDGDGAVEFGETLPDANVLKGGVDTLDSYAQELLAAAEGWEPTATDAFTALVVMVPTMSEYFASWRDSRFVSGEESTQRDFVAISRLADIQGILSGLAVVYDQVRPLAEGVDAAQAEQIATELADLNRFVGGVYAEEQGGKRFTPEEADTLGAEAQDRATAITGRISQIAGQLGIEIAE
jgi:hypothetical protein